MFAIGTDAFVIAPLLARIARDLDIGIAAAAQLITAYALAYALCSPFVATLTAHWRRERAVVTGLAVFAGANVAAAMAPGFAAVLAARAFAGLGAALFAPAASASAASLAAADRRGRALSIMMIGLSSATALGSPLGTVIGTVVELAGGVPAHRDFCGRHRRCDPRHNTHRRGDGRGVDRRAATSAA